MPKYLFQGSYTQEGLKGLLKEGGTSRRAVAEQLMRDAGGTLESFYFAFGEKDVIAIAELPDDVSVTALSLIVNSSGAVNEKITVLITPEALDEAAKKSIAYRPPGR